MTRRGVLPTAVLLSFIAGPLVGLFALGPDEPAGFTVRPFPSPTFTRQPVVGGTTNVAPTPRASRSRATRSRELMRSAAWASTSAARAVAQCESGNDHSAHSHSGRYRGKWQMDADFWRTYGGLRYASTPDRASEAAQDAVAYRGWLARGWQPWTCARIVGVYR